MRQGQVGDPGRLKVYDTSWPGSDIYISIRIIHVIYLLHGNMRGTEVLLWTANRIKGYQVMVTGYELFSVHHTICGPLSFIFITHPHPWRLITWPCIICKQPVLYRAHLHSHKDIERRLKSAGLIFISAPVIVCGSVFVWWLSTTWRL